MCAQALLCASQSSACCLELWLPFLKLFLPVLCVFICNWIKKRRESRANNVTLKLWRVREVDKPLKKEPFMCRLGRTPVTEDKGRSQECCRSPRANETRWRYKGSRWKRMEILMAEAFGHEDFHTRVGHLRAQPYKEELQGMPAEGGLVLASRREQV